MNALLTYLLIFGIGAQFTATTALAVSQQSKAVCSNRNEINETLSNLINHDDKLALLIDFDGTLAEINPNPVLTSIDPESEEILNRLVRHPNIYVAVISGRGVADVRQRVAIDNITYSGNHGMEVTFANHTEYHYPISTEVFNNCSNLRNVLEEKLAKNGAWVENKNVSLTYHYRQVPDSLQGAYVKEAKELIKAYGYIPVQAHYAIEIKPPVVWTKGNAAILILNETFGCDWESSQLKVFFAGDDNSDEDVMRLLKGKGISFRVSDVANINTNADVILKSTKTVTWLLEWLDNNL